MKSLIPVMLVLLPLFSFSQIDSSFLKRIKALDTANTLKADTIAVPDDLLTKKIKELLGERKGLTIGTILQIKIMEEQQKDTAHSKEFYAKLLEEISKGRTGTLIENTQVNLYRRIFTEKEIDDLLIFYKTSAGKKMDQESLLILVESAKNAEQLLKLAAKSIETRDKK